MQKYFVRSHHGTLNRFNTIQCIKSKQQLVYYVRYIATLCLLVSHATLVACTAGVSLLVFQEVIHTVAAFSVKREYSILLLENTGHLQINKTKHRPQAFI